MATYTIAEADVKWESVSVASKVAGEDIDAGMWLYLDSGTGKVFKARNDTAAKATVVGIAVSSARTNQPLNYISSGSLGFNVPQFSGAALQLVLSGTYGKAMDAADLSTGQYLSILGYSTDTDQMQIALSNTGQVK